MENHSACTCFHYLTFVYSLIGHVYSASAESIKDENTVRCVDCSAATKRNNKTQKQVHYFSLT